MFKSLSTIALATISQAILLETERASAETFRANTPLVYGKYPLEKFDLSTGPGTWPPSKDIIDLSLFDLHTPYDFGCGYAIYDRDQPPCLGANKKGTAVLISQEVDHTELASGDFHQPCATAKKHILDGRPVIQLWAPVRGVTTTSAHHARSEFRMGSTKFPSFDGKTHEFELEGTVMHLPFAG
jgi:hypothetical protein